MNVADNKKTILGYMRLARSNLTLSMMYGLMDTYGNIDKVLENLPLRIKRTGKNVIVPDFDVVEQEYNKVLRIGGSIVSLYDENYPELLKNINFPPFVITVLGDKSLMSRNSVSIVGSRNASFAGKKFAQMVSSCLGDEGYVICSGLAAGIDAVAHATAVGKGVPTIGVLGCGIDIIYPKENKDLYYQIIENGLLITEFPIGYKPLPVNFPMRNRIIAGISIASVVIEASRHSGSLITARYAIEFGREVFAAPGSPIDPRYEGVNQLIKDGATIADSCESIIDTLQFCTNKTEMNLFDSSRSERICFDVDKFVDNSISEEVINKIKHLLLERITYSPVSIDDILDDMSFEFDIKLIMIALVDLDLDGKIERNFLNQVSLLSNSIGV